MMPISKTVCSLFFPILIYGCFNLQQAAPQIDYYTLEYASPAVAALPPLSAAILVKRFQTVPWYDTEQIIYSDAAFKRQAYHYHRWRANPGDLVTYFLARDLRNSGRFAGVFVDSNRHKSTHSIEGVVEEFYEKDTQEVWKAVLTLAVTVIDQKENDVSRNILFNKTYRVEEQCRIKNPLALAESMSMAMATISAQIITDLYQSLSGTEIRK